MTEVACAIIMEGDRVLITQRSETMPHPLQWEFPGGKLKPGESPEKCIVREIREELKIAISVEQLLPAVVQEYTGKSIRLIPFVCKMTAGEIELHQHRDLAWVTPADLEKYEILAADLKVLDELRLIWE